MTMASCIVDADVRRVPRQQRGERRVTALLDAAASVIADTGYEGATMSEIAGRAGACIGSLYQFFPNKQSITEALRARYCQELRTLWASLEKTDSVRSARLVRELMDEMIVFIEERPALIPLLNMPFNSPDVSIRDLLRKRLARIFGGASPHLTKSRTLVLATVTLQIMKGMNELHAEGIWPPRRALVREYELVLNSYLRTQVEFSGRRKNR